MFQKRGSSTSKFSLLEYLSHANWYITFNGDPPKGISISQDSYLNYLDRKWYQNKKYPARGKLL